MLELNKIYCGDCLDLMKDIPDKSIDMILCDLPYGTTQNKWDVVVPLNDLWVHYSRIIKDNGMICLTASDPFTNQILNSKPKQFKYYDLIWNKNSCTGFLNANRAPLRQHEQILCFYKELPVYNPQMIEGKERYKGGYKKNNGCYGDYKETIPLKDNLYYPTSIISISNANQKDKQHPTEKPVALFEYLIKTYSNESDLVLDNCAGSCTTAVACIKTGRNFICIEKEPEYCKIGEKRIAALPNTKLQDWFE